MGTVDHSSKRPEARTRFSINNPMKYPEVAARSGMARRGLAHPWQCGERNPAKRPEVRAKPIANNAMKLNLEVRDKVSMARTGRSNPWVKGEKNPMNDPEVRARHNEIMRSPRVRARLSAAHTGKPHTEEHRQSIGRSQRGVPRPWQIGENNPSWNDGSSFWPYCRLFNKEFKEETRMKWNNVCLICGSPPNGRSLPVHHIHYDKEAGCNGRGLECVPLCHSHHGKSTQIQYREWWVAYFENRLWNAFGWHIDIIYE